MENLKNQIKELSKQQVILRNQRKTVRLQGERTIEPWQAFYQHQSNRIKLRELYFAYGLLKGKKSEEIELKAYTPINMNNVNQIISQYATEIICNSEK